METLVLRETEVTDSVLVSSSVPETDYAAWSATTSYAVGAYVMRSSIHKIYQCLVAGVSSTPPEDNATKWQYVGMTNRWRMFDKRKSSQTTATETITVQIAPGQVVNAIALTQAEGQVVTITMTAGGVTVWSDFASLDSSWPEDEWEWCFGGFEPIRKVLFRDIPPYAEGVITITITGSGTVACGACVPGTLWRIATPKRDGKLSMKTYHTSEADSYGVWTFIERDVVDTFDVDLELRTDELNAVDAIVKSLSATPSIWIGYDDTRMTSTMLLGFPTKWERTFPYYDFTVCKLIIEEVADAH